MITSFAILSASSQERYFFKGPTPLELRSNSKSSFASFSNSFSFVGGGESGSFDLIERFSSENSIPSDSFDLFESSNWISKCLENSSLASWP